MAEKEMADEFLSVVAFTLECILNNDYREDPEADGSLRALELRRGLARESVNVAFLEQYFGKVLSAQQSEALFSLKDRRTPEEIEAVLHLMFPPETALGGAIELADADWEEILLYVNRQLEFRRKIGEVTGELITKERERFSSPFGSGVESLIRQREPSYLDYFTARQYVRELRGLLPNIVKRAQVLHLLAVSRIVPKDVRTYMVEASGSYVYGHFRASLVLCRSAIEAAVKGRLIESGHANEVKAIAKDWLEELLKLAREKRLLDDILWKQADDIRRLANRAMHPGKGLPTETECKDALIQTRGILQHLYE